MTKETGVVMFSFEFNDRPFYLQNGGYRLEKSVIKRRKVDCRVRGWGVWCMCVCMCGGDGDSHDGGQRSREC